MNRIGRRIYFWIIVPACVGFVYLPLYAKLFAPRIGVIKSFVVFFTTDSFFDFWTKLIFILQSLAFLSALLLFIWAGLRAIPAFQAGNQEDLRPGPRFPSHLITASFLIVNALLTETSYTLFLIGILVLVIQIPSLIVYLIGCQGNRETQKEVRMSGRSWMVRLSWLLFICGASFQSIGGFNPLPGSHGEGAILSICICSGAILSYVILRFRVRSLIRASR